MLKATKIFLIILCATCLSIFVYRVIDNSNTIKQTDIISSNNKFSVDTMSLSEDDLLNIAINGNNQERQTNNQLNNSINNNITLDLIVQSAEKVLVNYPNFFNFSKELDRVKADFPELNEKTILNNLEYIEEITSNKQPMKQLL